MKKRLLIFALLLIPLSSGLEDFSIVAVPDIQYYTGQGIGIQNISNWILNNTEEENIKMVLFLGDLADTHSYRDNEGVAWELAREGIWSLNNSVPFMVVPGNHDTNAKYCEYFCNQNATNFSQFSNYKLMNVSGMKIGFLGFDFQPTDEEVVEARGIIQNHSDYQWIVFTHSYLSWYSGYVDYVEGRKIKGMFLEQTNNTLMIISAHFDGYYAHMENQTFSIVTGHKSPRHPYVGDSVDGTMGIYRFKPQENIITGDWYSVNLNKSHSSFNMTYQMTPVFQNVSNATNYTIQEWANQTFYNETSGMNETQQVLVNNTYQNISYHIEEVFLNRSLVWNYGEPYYVPPPEIEEEVAPVQNSGGGGGSSAPVKVKKIEEKVESESLAYESIEGKNNVKEPILIGPKILGDAPNEIEKYLITGLYSFIFLIYGIYGGQKLWAKVT